MSDAGSADVSAIRFDAAVDGAGPWMASLAARDADGLAARDESLGRLDERVTVFTVGECRDSAWRTAKALISRFSGRRRFARWFNDVTSTGAAYLTLSSRTSDRAHEALLDTERSAGDGR